MAELRLAEEAAQLLSEAVRREAEEAQAAPFGSKEFIFVVVVGVLFCLNQCFLETVRHTYTHRHTDEHQHLESPVLICAPYCTVHGSCTSHGLDNPCWLGL